MSNVVPVFRRATLDDLPQVVQIEQQVHRNPWSEALLRDSFLGQHLVWVAENSARQPSEQDSTLLGYMIVMPVCDQWELLNLAVSQAFQGKGFGQKWIEFLVTQAHEQRVSELLLEVRQSNDSAIGLYGKNGFTTVGRRKNYYPLADGREDALLMQRMLA